LQTSEKVFAKRMGCEEGWAVKKKFFVHASALGESSTPKQPL